VYTPVEEISLDRGANWQERKDMHVLVEKQKEEARVELVAYTLV
jgi:hypothetical protein